MSELTQCNLCSLRAMQKRAATRGATVIVEVNEGPDLVGWTSARYSDFAEPTAYFLRIPEECAC